MVFFGLCCAGCWQTTNSSLDEQKDPHYLRGKSLMTSLDYSGAAEAFGKALEANPRNASAHFELFYLCEQKLSDYAAAIYHGEQFLRLRPKSEYAEIVRHRIDGCKQELAKTIPVGPVTPALQREFERLTAENKDLRQRNELLQQRLFMATNSALVPTWPSPAGTGVVSRPGPTNLYAGLMPTNTPARPAVSSPPAAKTHTVKSGDTLTSIARKYRVTLETLRAANPGVNPLKLKVGQVLQIPAK